MAGAAYRLGLKLFDERTGKWHDFRRRKLGEEIVRALTVAPKDAPAWATDPGLLWNKVEAMEKRKDAQVARDYRIPIPFGLTDQQAGDLAEEMARYIAANLNVPVSMGLHRDADRDVLGAVKPNDKQGFHAHLYFPTRRLAKVGEDGESEGGQPFGAKLTLLSNKRTSAAFVESLNEKWAELANGYRASQGLPANYDHRSYERQGISRPAEPTVGRAAAAMQRKGQDTRKGSELKDARNLACLFEHVHAEAMKSQHARAVADLKREQAAKLPRLPGVSIANRLQARRVGKGFVRMGTMALRLQSIMPAPKSKADREALARSLILADHIEQVLRSLRDAQGQVCSIQATLDQATTRRLDAEFERDQGRRARSRAVRRLKTWEQEHPWRRRAAKIEGSVFAKEKAIMRADIDGQHERVQVMKTAVVQETATIEQAREQLAGAEAAVTARQTDLQQALAELEALDLSANGLLRVVPEELRDVLGGEVGQVQCGVETMQPEEPGKLERGLEM
ncbi:hypothetical protein BTJ49_03230 [Oleiagrimonas sp. MCCC 1A03011]|nr:hypothetical protein BTJ49_03230 [Oleiagrimonas sp. MCCC 1A03011]